MALTFAELLLEDGGDASKDSVIKGTSRRFKVPGLTPEDALADPTLNSLPPIGAQIGTLHPRNPVGQSLKCAGHKVGARLGNGADSGYYVTAVYNPEGVASAGGSPPDVTSPKYLDQSSSTTTTTIPYPIIVTRTIPSPRPAIGGVPQTPLKGFDHDIQIKELVIPTATYAVTFNRKTWTVANMNAVATQTNKVHTFFGTRWCFEGADANQVWEAKLWTITYRWFTEPATPQSTWVPLYDVAAGEWVSTTISQIPDRAAFERWEVNYLDLTAITTPPPGYDYTALIIPYVVAIKTKVDAPNGEQSLPGWSASAGVDYTFTVL